MRAQNHSASFLNGSTLVPMVDGLGEVKYTTSLQVTSGKTNKMVKANWYFFFFSFLVDEE